ncbi:MAG TPA: FAD-dependent oxidoreductase [Ktedonobacterales bacterium]
MRVRSLPQLRHVLSPREMAQVTRIGLEIAFGKPTPADSHLSAADWLSRRINPDTSPTAWRFFQRVTHFALSVDLPDVSYPELIETGRNLLRYGPPGIVDGGCAAITGELERRVAAGGGEIRLRQDVRAIAHDGQRVTGVQVRDQITGEESHVTAPLIISNIAPEVTRSLACLPSAHAATPAAAPRKEASGLKVHLLSDHSIIPHKGIMFCLDTDRIAGIVQVTNADPRLAPAGKHLLITHQLMRSDDVNAEREAARADLRYLFGDAFGTSINILTMSQYRGEWPVNRARQGEDLPQTLPLAGLYLVGDAVKPSGYLMVEGVAQSVNTLFDVIEATTGTPAAGAPATRPGGHVPPKPARSRALRWLVAPPAPHPDSRSAATGRVTREA